MSTPTLAQLQASFTGQWISWRTASGTATGYVASVSGDGVSVTSRDGHRNYWPTSAWTDVHDLLKNKTVVPAPAPLPATATRAVDNWD
jgi:hypothetical protein